MNAPGASTPKWRVSDEELGQFETRARDYKLGARADVMLPAGFIGDLRDARALIAERDAEIAKLKVIAASYVELRDGLEALCEEYRAAGIAEGFERAAKIADREFGALYDKARQILSSASGEIPSDYFKAMDKAEGNRQTAAAIRAAIATASKGGDA